MFISSFTLQNDALINPLLLFYLESRPVGTKKHRLVEYISRECFNSFVQSTVNARRQQDEDPNSSVVAETMKLVVADGSNGFQFMDCSRRTVTKHLNDEKMQTAINTKLLKELNHVNNALWEVELAKAEIEQKKQSISGFSSFNTENSECWNSTTTFSLNFVM